MAINVIVRCARMSRHLVVIDAVVEITSIKHYIHSSRFLIMPQILTDHCLKSLIISSKVKVLVFNIANQ